MARVEGEFQSDVIRAFKGVLDFYYWRGIPVVRSWPRKPVLPRNPAVQSAGQDWRDNSKALSSLPLSLQTATADEVKDTSYTWKDAWTSAVYGHGVSWGSANDHPPQFPENTYVMNIDLVASPSDAGVTFNVNSTAYVSAWSKYFLVPFAVVPFTHYRVLGSMGSSAAGQTVQLAVSTPGVPPVPIHAPDPDLTITNTFQFWDSGWRSIDNIPAVDTVLALAFKGSNATVDISLQRLQVVFARL